ncbi:MAG TPA: sigma-70 family RNA polymerase sigma factor [Acidobacteriaceae bacterium]|nr:sigma-70 family RNA polymerase sigma factor [Acidobacteriaceae bacterium]
MPFRRPSFRSSRHPDEPPRKRDAASDAAGDPLEIEENELNAPEVSSNDEVMLPADDENHDPALLEEPSDVDDEEGEEAAQRFAEDGVKEDMATAAVHPQTRVSPQAGSHSGEVRAALGVAALAPNAWSQLSDAEIMLRVAAGDEAGFPLLVEKYRRQMVHYMYRMVHNQAIAEELAQEVFLRVYRARASYRAEAKFSTWIYRIATNLGVNHARDTRHERGAQTVYLDQPDPETGMSPDVADTTPSVEQDMLRDARLAAIRKHVMALPERQRTAVLMHKYQDLDYKQIGAVLKLSESATKSLLFRAYQTLRERLKEFV